MSRINLEKRLKSLLGIRYTVSEPEFYPIIPDLKDNKNNLIQQLLDGLRGQIGSKKQLFKTYTELQNQPLVESLLLKVITDLLWKGRGEQKPLLEVEYTPDKGVQNDLNEIIKNFRIEDHITECMFDLLLFGEYYYYIDWANTEIDDRYDYPDLLPVYTRGEVEKVLYTASTNTLHKYGEFTRDKFIESHEVFILSLPSRRMKIKVRDESGSEYYVKIPIPFVIPSAITLLNSLALMEKLIPLTQVMRMDRGQIVNISVPPNTPIKQIFEICKEYEKQLNSTLNLNLSLNTMEEILSSFGRFKCIPSLNTGKADMGVRDQPEPRTVDLRDMEYLVATIANRIGVPVSYIIDLGQGQEDPKTLLTYLQKLHFIRKEIGKGVKRFLLNYLEYRRTSGEKYKMIKSDELKVKLPPVPGIETLDAIDVADSLSGMLSNIQRIIDDFNRMFQETEETLPELDRRAMLDILNTKLEPILGRKIFDLKKLKKPEPPEDEKPPEDDEEPRWGNFGQEKPEPEPTVGEPGADKTIVVDNPGEIA